MKLLYFYLIGEYLFSPQAYLREGVALQNLGQHGEALAAFGAGLAQDANNTNLITGLIDAALKSPLKGRHNFEAQHYIYNSLEKQFFQPLKNFLWFIENHLVTPSNIF